MTALSPLQCDDDSGGGWGLRSGPYCCTPRRTKLPTPYPTGLGVSKDGQPCAVGSAEGVSDYSLKTAAGSKAYPLGDEEGDQEDGDGADDAEDKDDTGLPAGPVAALHQVGNGILAASDERHIKGGHCCCGSVSGEGVSWILWGIGPIGPRAVVAVCQGVAQVDSSKLGGDTGQAWCDESLGGCNQHHKHCGIGRRVGANGKASAYLSTSSVSRGLRSDCRRVMEAGWELSGGRLVSAIGPG